MKYKIKFDKVPVTLNKSKWTKYVTYNFGYSLEVVLGKGQNVHYTVDNTTNEIIYEAEFAKLKPNQNGFLVLYID